MIFSPLLSLEDCLAQETRFETIELKDGKKIEYAVVVPHEFDSENEYPILLALPPGGQNREMVNAGLNLYWQDAAEANRWVVISPIAPNKQSFSAGSEDLIPEFLKKIQENYKPDGGKFHLAGVSNGGISAFRIAGKYPDRFHSLMVLPGYPASKEDQQRLKTIGRIPIAMFVGEKDSLWVKSMKTTESELRNLGANVQLEIVKGEGHVIRSWKDGKKLFTILNKWHAEVTKGKHD